MGTQFEEYPHINPLSYTSNSHDIQHHLIPPIRITHFKLYTSSTHQNNHRQILIRKVTA